MSAQTTLTVQELGATYGVLFTGCVMGMMCYGFTLFQTYVYYSHYPLDHWVIKVTVGSLGILDTIGFGLISHALYYYLILSYPDTPPLLDCTSTYCAEIGVSVLITFIVQIHFSHRVWIKSQNATIAVTIAIISFAAFALGIATTGIIAKNLFFSTLSTPQGKGLMTSSLGVTFLSGAAAFAALCFYSPALNPAVKLTERFYNITVEYAIIRGCVATTIQFVYLVTFISAPTKFFWVPFHLISSKLFINSFLTMLNVREVHQGHGVNGNISGRKTNTTSSSSVPRITSNMRFAVVESKSGVNNYRTTTPTTTRLILDENEANDWHHKGTGSKV